MPKVYTKTGDTGETSLLGGGRVTKDCITMRVVGELDELNAALGVVVSSVESGYTDNPDLRMVIDMIEKIQRDLFKVGAEVAGCQLKGVRCKVLGDRCEVANLKLISEREIDELEKSIDRMWGELPELKNFIIPGGASASAHLHLARAICRRAERELVGFGKTVKLRPELYQYLNRLSDWLFTAARWANYAMKIEEKII